MQRKIVQQGAGAHTISLPVDWVRQARLGAGSLVNVEKYGSHVVVSSASGEPSRKEVSVDVTHESERQIRILLQNLYRLGYDHISFTHTSSSQRKHIEQVCDDYLPGFELTQVGKNHCVLESIAEPTSEKQEVMLRRMFYIIGESLKILHEDIKEGTLVEMEQIVQLTKKLDQCDNFCRRNITRQRFSNEAIYFFWGFFSYLHLLQRGVAHLYEQGKRCQIPAEEREKICASLAHLQMLFEQFHVAYFKEDRQSIEDVSEQSSTLLYESLLPALGTTKSAIVYYYLAEHARLLSVVTSPALSILLAKKTKEE